MTTIETKTSKNGYYHGMPCFTGWYRVFGISPGFDLGWTRVTNLDGRIISYQDTESAKRGAETSAQYWLDNK